MTGRLLAEQHLDFLSLKGVCTGSSESICVKMPHCWISHVPAHMSCGLNQYASFSFIFSNSILNY